MSRRIESAISCSAAGYVLCWEAPLEQKEDSRPFLATRTLRSQARVERRRVHCVVVWRRKGRILFVWSPLPPATRTQKLKFVRPHQDDAFGFLQLGLVLFDYCSRVLFYNIVALHHLKLLRVLRGQDI